MPTKDFLGDHHIVSGVYPVADCFATSKTTDYVCLRDYRRATFLIHCGNSTGGDSDGVITVLAADDADATNAVAMAFKYRTCASSTTVDTWGALTAATSSGVAMNGADNYMYAVEVTADEVLAAGLGDSTAHDADWVALKVTEDTDDPVVAGIIIILSDPRYPQAVPRTAIA